MPRSAACGVLRVNTISEVFDMAEVLAKQPRPEGPRLAIVTNAGGPGVLATDALIEHRGELATLSAETMATLERDPARRLEPRQPDRHPRRRRPRALRQDAGDRGQGPKHRRAARDPDSPGHDRPDRRRREQLRRYAKVAGKPVLASWMGGERSRLARRSSTRRASRRSLIPTPPPKSSHSCGGRPTTSRACTKPRPAARRRRRLRPPAHEAEAIVAAARREGRTVLTEVESKQILAAYGIPTVETRIAATEDDAVAAAEDLGYPVVLKLHSKTITHKTDVGGVQLNLRRCRAVRSAYPRHRVLGPRPRAGDEHFQGVSVQPMIKLDGYELIVGSSLDPQFGPVLLFGTGGQLVEVFKDRALGPAAPQHHPGPADDGADPRSSPRSRACEADSRWISPALEQLLVRFSHLVVEQQWIKEIDINPLLASPSGSWPSTPG